MAFQWKHASDVDSYCCPVCGRGQPANLLIAGLPIAVHVEGRAAEGFSVLAEGRPPIEVGAVVQLRSATGWYQVRVTEVVEEEPGDADWQEASAGLFRVGLHEIREYRDPGFNEGREAGGRVAIAGQRALPSWVLALLRWVFWGVSILAIPTGVVLLFWYSGAMVERFQQWRSTLSRPPATQQVSPEALLQAAVRLPGADVFAVPEIAKELELTDAQQEEIRKIQAMTGDAFRQIDPKLDRASRQTEAEIRQRILDAARQEALKVLTPEQRKRWDALAAAAPRG